MTLAHARTRYYKPDPWLCRLPGLGRAGGFTGLSWLPKIITAAGFASSSRAGTALEGLEIAESCVANKSRLWQ